MYVLILMTCAVFFMRVIQSQVHVFVNSQSSLQRCICVYMNVCMYVCMYICMYVCSMYAYMNAIVRCNCSSFVFRMKNGANTFSIFRALDHFRGCHYHYNVDDGGIFT